jgi:hypothetical protein
MSQLNVGKRKATRKTHEGAPTKKITTEQKLRRSVMACLLWEDTFYEEGESIGVRIKKYAAKVSPEYLSGLAKEARTLFKLRHVPLLLARELARGQGNIVGNTIRSVVQRPDEIGEFLSIYWGTGDRLKVKVKDRPLSSQVKKGLAEAFTKFDGYQLAKYNRKGKPITLRDAMFLVRPKPKDKEQEEIFKQLAEDTLLPPDTWEVSLSAGKDKKETFERLLSEKRLGYMALLRNLRNMHEAGCDKNLVKRAIIEGASKSKALPFRFISAALAAPTFEKVLDTAMALSLEGMPKLSGSTAILIDCSASMDWTISNNSTMSLRDTATSLAILAAGVCEDFSLYGFGTDYVELPARASLAMMDAVRRVNNGGPIEVGHGTNIGKAVNAVKGKYDRIIVITDCQSHDPVSNPECKGYIINVASYKNGIGYGKWTNIDGFSEQTLRYIAEIEQG